MESFGVSFGGEVVEHYYSGDVRDFYVEKKMVQPFRAAALETFDYEVRRIFSEGAEAGVGGVPVEDLPAVEKLFVRAGIYAR